MEEKIVYLTGVSIRPGGCYATIKEKQSGKLVFEQKCINEDIAIQVAIDKKRELFG